MRLGDGTVQEEVQVISTGSLGLDIALGVGGLPRGRIAEVYGLESSGKTTLALHVLARAQKLGGVCAFIDAEHALDIGYAKRLGVQTDELLVAQPDYGEQALEITDKLVKSGAIDIIVVDSVAALVPKAELEGDTGDSHVGLHARLMSQALRKLTGNVSRSNTLVIFINQLRMKIGVMFGSPETTTGATYWRQKLGEDQLIAELDRAIERCVKGGMATHDGDELTMTRLGRACASKGIGVATGAALARWATDARLVAFTEREVILVAALTKAGGDVHITLNTNEFNRVDYKGELLHRAQGAGAIERPVFAKHAESRWAPEYEDAKAFKKALTSSGIDSAEIDALVESVQGRLRLRPLGHVDIICEP